MNLEDEKIIMGFLNGDNEVICYIYKTFFPVIENMILKFDGSKEDARDIFQDSLILIYMNLKEKKKIKPNLCFGSLLFTVARNKQIDLLRHRLAVSLFNKENNHEEEIVVPEEVTDLFKEIEKYILYERYFNSLSPECKKLLKYSLQDIPLKRITLLMNFKTDDYTKHRRYKCKEYLMNSIIKDPKYHKLRYD